jgi:DNA-binding FrmR family transcriptional regulator
MTVAVRLDTYTLPGIQDTRQGMLGGTMSHVVEDKRKLLNRVRRLRGQINAIERALESEADCIDVMRLLTAGRGAINGIMAIVVEDHIQLHLVAKHRKPPPAETEATNQLIDVLRSYIE